MSLKAFHFVFIVIAILLTGGFAAWCLRTYLSERESSMLLLALGSLITLCGLVVYAVRVRRKLKDFGWV